MITITAEIDYYEVDVILPNGKTRPEQQKYLVTTCKLFGIVVFKRQKFLGHY